MPSVLLIPSLGAVPVTERKISRIVCHHSAGNSSDSVAAVRRFHTEVRGWKDIGYHYCLRQDGNLWRVELGRPVDQPGAHVQGYNADSIAVCVFGDWSKRPLPQEARDLLAVTLAALCRGYCLTERAIYGHNELSPTLCPGYPMVGVRSDVFDVLELPDGCA